MEAVLARRVIGECPAAARSAVHGVEHWMAVATAGASLARSERLDESGVAVAWLFGLLHDCQRRHDGPDPEHGPRAARYAERLWRRGLVRLDAERLALLLTAIRRHDRGETTAETTIGCCWDADRLQLGRVGVRPHARYLSTRAGRLAL